MIPFFHKGNESLRTLQDPIHQLVIPQQRSTQCRRRHVVRNGIGTIIFRGECRHQPFELTAQAVFNGNFVSIRIDPGVTGESVSIKDIAHHVTVAELPRIPFPAHAVFGFPGRGIRRGTVFYSILWVNFRKTQQHLTNPLSIFHFALHRIGKSQRKNTADFADLGIIDRTGNMIVRTVIFPGTDLIFPFITAESTDGAIPVFHCISMIFRILFIGENHLALGTADGFHIRHQTALPRPGKFRSRPAIGAETLEPGIFFRNHQFQLFRRQFHPETAQSLDFLIPFPGPFVAADIFPGTGNIFRTDGTDTTAGHSRFIAVHRHPCPVPDSRHRPGFLQGFRGSILHRKILKPEPERLMIRLGRRKNLNAVHRCGQSTSHHSSLPIQSFCRVLTHCKFTDCLFPEWGGPDKSTPNRFSGSILIICPHIKSF